MRRLFVADSTRTQRTPVLVDGKALSARTWSILSGIGLEVYVVLALGIVALVAHGFNMFNYPAYTLLDDEGIYTGQAWAVLTQHRLAPFTFIYETPPVGWIILAAWMGLTGGLHTFGGSIDSGRVLMLILHLGMIPMVYGIARKLGCNVAAAACATLLFSLSPLALFYQRFVLVDTVMLFLALLSLDLLLDGWGRLSRVVFSGVCFGLAILSKESAVALLPGMVFIAIQQRWRHQGRFAFIGWVTPMLVVVSLYPMYAFLKGELFPTFDVPLGNLSPTRVSLMNTLFWEYLREGGGLLNYSNQFWELVRNDWFKRDALLLAGGAVAALINLRRGISSRQAMAVALLSIGPLLYLARGGMVLNYQILLAIPFLCLSLAAVFSVVLEKLPKPAMVASTLTVVVAIGLGYWSSGNLQPLFSEYPVVAGRTSTAWIKENISPESRIITRDDMWTDLRAEGMDGPAFPYVYTHWKVSSDPAVRDDVFKQDWHNVDYLITSPNIEKEFIASKNTVALEALKNAHLVKQWKSEPGTQGLHNQQIVELWKVDKVGVTETETLKNSAKYIENNFSQQGAFASSDGSVTALSQSNALLRAVWSNDRAGFNRTWAWTKQNLQNPQGLLYWLRQNDIITDAHTATHADNNTALALLLGSKLWNDPELAAAGTRMVKAIWNTEVLTIKGKPYQVAGDWAATGQGQILAINPSYFAPYAFRIFKDVDPTHNWQAVIDAGYDLLFNASKAPLGYTLSAGLPPDWIGLNRYTGELSALQLTDKTDTTRYGFDAPRVYFNIALDLRWSGDGRAKTYLQQAGFLKDEVGRLLQDGVTRKGLVSAIYKHDGSVVIEQPNLVGSAGAMAALLTLDPGAANTIYSSQVIGQVGHNSKGLYFGDQQDLIAQEWGWFATGLYANRLTDFWHNTTGVQPVKTGIESQGGRK
jgi:endo-1,4-beta-D-glucanase Y